MAQSQRDRLAAVIRGWHGAARSLESRPATVAACEPLVLALEDHLARQSTMAALAETYLSDGGGWPVDLPRPVGVSSGVGVEVIVAASYWRRYRQLIAQVTCEPEPSGEADSALSSTTADHDRPGAPLSTDLDPIDLGYLARLWQRGPQRLRCIPIDRLYLCETMVDEAYARVADCDSVCELAKRYLADGDWVLEVARTTLPRLGEPPSTIGWVQDTACWRRFQELTAERIRREERERPHPGFSFWLAQHMARHHFSVPELARRLTLDETVVRDWLAARVLPDDEFGPRLAALFGLSEAQWPRIAATASV